MLKNKYIKSGVSSLLILLALWVATPKVYTHNLLHHNHSETSAGPETKVTSASGEDCDFEKYDKPVYFSIFKFIFSFLPVKSDDDDKADQTNSRSSSLAYAMSLLRTLPVSH